MPDRTQLDCDVHDLLNEANVLTLLPILNIRKARNLIERMRLCAEQTKVAGAGYEDSLQRLSIHADRLEHKADLAATIGNTAQLAE